MQIYIAYKYRRIPNKPGLINELEGISDYFKALGHIPFILGRDVQDWGTHESSQFKTTIDIFKNIRKKDLLFVYVNSNVHSNGIPVEVMLAKLFGLKIIVATKAGVKSPWLRKFADHYYEFPDLTNLKAKAAEAFSKLIK